MAQSDSSHEHQMRPIIQHTTGGISLGAYKRIEQMGDLVAGNKISIVVYTGPAQPPDHAARQALERAYRSEIIARYAVWRERYVRLPMQATMREDTGAVSGPFFEREDFVFAALSARLSSASNGTVAPPAVPQTPEVHTFSDLREGLQRYRDLLLLGPPVAEVLGTMLDGSPGARPVFSIFRRPAPAVSACGWLPHSRPLHSTSRAMFPTGG
jgi:hypothetical protein